MVAGNIAAFDNALGTALSDAFPTAKLVALTECDLFSLSAIEAALPKTIDLVVFSHRSAKPTAHVDQGLCSDYDLIVADNMARSVVTRGVQHFVSLSTDRHLLEIFSDHGLSLRSLADFVSTVPSGPIDAPRLFRQFALSRTVRSVQKWRLPQGSDAAETKNQYFSWLVRMSGSLIRAEIKGDEILLKIPFLSPPILRFVLNRDRSDRDLQWLDIRGGFMAARNNLGRFELRVICNRTFLVAAIHDYTPSLPWAIYRWTQAVAHLLVMNCFKASVVRGTK